MNNQRLKGYKIGENVDRRKGHTALTMSDLGPEPIIKLNTASLRVGEVMARARLEGCNVDEAKVKAIEHTPGQDFSLEQKRRYELIAE